MATPAPVPIQLIPNPTSPTQKLINTLAVIQQQGQQNAVGDSLVGLPAPPASTTTTGGAGKVAKSNLKTYVLMPQNIKLRAKSRDEAALIGYWQLTANTRPKTSHTIDFTVNSQKYRGTKRKISSKNYKYDYENTIFYI